jgi:signal transduction histidine kinase
LCPFSLEILGLPAALDECLQRGSEKAGFKGKVRNSLKSDELDNLSIVELSLLYRLVQESITNICKHAAATAVRITIENRDGVLAIAVIDDGKGIDAGGIKSESRGVAYMRQRADLIGASVNWKSGEDNRGTVVEILMNLFGRKSDNNLDR